MREPEIRRKHILIVEDEEALAVMVQHKLQQSGYTAHVETRGRDALAYAAKHPIDLAVLDINLPDITGYQVAKELRALSYPWVVPMMMLTIKDQPVDQLRGFAHGADAYVTKPFSAVELCHTVAQLIGDTPVATDP